MRPLLTKRQELEMIPVKRVMDSDFVIVGGGIAGLSAAISAGQAGVKVTVLERRIYGGAEAAVGVMTISSAICPKYTARTSTKYYGK